MGREANVAGQAARTGFVERGLRFGVVGAVAFLIDTGLTLLLAQALHYVAANTVGFFVANAVNFLLGHFWAFRDVTPGCSAARTYPLILAVSAVGLGLSDLLIYALVGLAGMALLPGKVVTAGLVMIWNFGARHYWIYH